MTGFRQFRSLLRKNVLLKSRRPWATAFEIGLPLCLFMLLAYVRGVYEIRQYGPYFYDNQLLSPMGLGMYNVAGSKALSDLAFNGEGKPWEEATGENLPSGFLGGLMEAMSCDEGVNMELAKMLEQVLRMPSPDGGTLADAVMRLDMEEFSLMTSKALEDAFKTVKGGGPVTVVQASVKGYFASTLPDEVGKATVDAQSMIQVLSTLLSQPNSSAKAREAVELAMTGGNCSAVNISGIGWPTDSSGYASNISGYATSPAALGVVNRSALAQQLKDLSIELEASGFADYLRAGSADTVSMAMSSMNNSELSELSYFLDPVRFALAEATPENANLLLIAAGEWFEQSDVGKLAQALDPSIWWLSHFLRSRSVTARLLRERKDDTAWMADGVSQATDMASQASGMMGWDDEDQGDEMLSDDLTFVEANTGMLRPDDFRTEAGYNTYGGLKRLQDDISPLVLGLEAETFAQAMTELTGTAQQQSDSALDQLTPILDQLRDYSVEQIEELVVPRLVLNWTARTCSDPLVAAAGHVVERMHERCPFYRAALPVLGESARAGDFNRIVSDFHSYLETFDWSELRKTVKTTAEEYEETFEFMRVGGIEALRSTQDFFSQSANSAQVDPAQVAHRLAWALTWEFRRQREELEQCSQDPYHVVPNGEGRRRRRQMGARRLQSQSNYIQRELLRRKVLIAPYKGDVKELVDLALVELVLGLVEDYTHGKDDSTIPGLLGEVVKCPLVRSNLAQATLELLKERMLLMDSEQQVEEFAREKGDEVLLAIVFKTADKDGNFASGPFNEEYAIRAHALLLPPTSKIIRISQNAMFGSAGGSSFYAYMDTGFSGLQEVFGRAAARFQFIREEKKTTTVLTDVGVNMAAHKATAKGRRLKVSLEQFPVAPYEVDSYIRIIQHSLPMFLVLGWIYAVSLLVREVVYEKQERLKDVMRIQGLKTWVYWSSWVSSAMIQMTLLVSLLVFLMSAGQITKHSDPTVLFTFFWLYSLATVSFSMFISSFFSRAKVAAACAGLAYWMAYMPYALYNQYEEVLSVHAKNAFCLLSSTAMGVGTLIIGKWELVEVGLQWNNVNSPIPVTNSGAAPTDGHCMGTVWFMLIVDTIVYQVLAWYVEKVNPGTLGLPQPWYFPFMKSYWFPEEVGNIGAPSLAGNAEQLDNKNLECWEAAPAEAASQTSVQIHGLSKTFPNGKQALQGVTLELHTGTIMGLLGHNGAGKSTTMAILTGLYPPSSGDVLVHGASVRRDSLAVRKQLGVCLQHNALYESITVEEHLRLFSCLKSVPADQVQSEVDQLLADTGLLPKRNAPSRALSGGMKRKLSIAIALTGSSKVVTLDEPTAGVDATSRRDIWHLLVKYKMGRTILLSTHFMDEADILSDRIAIIAEGQLTAIASSMSLKRHFADGYMLTVVCEGTSADVSKLAQAVLDTVPDASFAGARGREFCFALPFSSRAHFPALFEKLQDDETRAAFKVDAYGLSAPSMEEVFLRASSVHEQGLHGKVRNLSTDGMQIADGSDGDSTSVGGESAPSGAPSSRSELPVGVPPGTAAGSVLPSSSQDKSSKNDRLGATPIVMGLPIVSREDPEDDDRPQSPQCMTGEPTKSGVAPPPTQQHAELPEDAVPIVVAKEQAIPARKPAPICNKGHMLWKQQFDALFRKRAISVRRDRRAWASQVVLPAIFVFLALFIARILEVQEEEPALKLTSDMLVGIIHGGATATSMAHNDIIWSDSLGGNLSQEVYDAFAAGKNSGDHMSALEGDISGLAAKHIFDNGKELSHIYMAAEVSGEVGGLAELTLWFKNQAYHGIPIAVSLWNNARFQLLGQKDCKISVWNHPLPKTAQMIQEEMTGSSQVYTDLFVALTVILAMGFIPASFVVYLTHEKASNGKHQQFLTGVSPGMYWWSSYCWDIVNYLVPLTVCFILFSSFQVMAYSGDNTGAIFCLLLCYGLCMTPLMYCVEPLFSVPSTAYVTLICVNIFTGTVSTLTVAVLEAYQQEVPDLVPILHFGQAVFPWILPNYCLGRGMLQIAMNHYANYAFTEFGVCARRDDDCWVDPLRWDVSGQFITNLVVMVPVWLGLRLLIEWGFLLRKVKQRLQERMRPIQADETEATSDQAVKDEMERIAAGPVNDTLLINKLEKSFVRGLGLCQQAVSHRAVRGISVGVPPGECFGLLGVNGAGKTTTMRMITGDTEVTAGEVRVAGANIQNQRDEARSHLGYCPQFDALPDKLTVRETIALYSRIRGIPAEDVPEAVETMITRMCLEAHQNRICEHLSGGNKRKLSTALALIGEPDVVLLDEPSTGVDVGARRFLWDVIGEIRKSGHAVVLTSHSMEECEVLCTRLTIMVHGQFRCLGSPMELKAKYGGGYSLAVKALPGKENSGRTTAEHAAQIRNFIKSKVPSAQLAEVSVGLLRYRIGSQKESDSEKLPLADIFRDFEEAAASGGELEGALSDYALSQTSLEEVFIHFSREAGVAEDPEITAMVFEERAEEPEIRPALGEDPGEAQADNVSQAPASESGASVTVSIDSRTLFKPARESL